MAFKPANCPKCGGSLQIPDDKDVVKCMYCGESIVVREVLKVQTQANLENLFRLADSAAEANNNQEAYNYYTQILEYDGKNADAWFGKGLSAGWQSTLANFKIPEMVSCFKNSIKFSEKDKIENVKTDASDKINSISIALYNLSKDHLTEFASLDDTWPDYLNKCSEIIDAFETAYELNPSSKSVIENIIFVCSDNIKGISFYDDIEEYTRTLHISQNYEVTLKEKITNFESILQKIDPNYVAPTIKKAGSCFVVTATMGNSSHSNVILLREFRDKQLLKYNIGRRFIEWYNKNGPSYASIIENSFFLKKISYIFIVIPASFIAQIAKKLR